MKLFDEASEQNECPTCGIMESHAAMMNRVLAMNTQLLKSFDDKLTELYAWHEVYADPAHGGDLLKQILDREPEIDVVALPPKSRGVQEYEAALAAGGPTAIDARREARVLMDVYDKKKADES